MPQKFSIPLIWFFRIVFINEFIITMIYTGSDAYIPSQLTRHNYANHHCR